jgi:hypothetical protein
MWQVKDFALREKKGIDVPAMEVVPVVRKMLGIT